ncbi:MAG: peptidase S8, partial [Flammeovirgaceae bacterium]
MKAFAIFLLLTVSLMAEAQLNRYFVFFKDKANSIYSVNNPTEFLSAKSLARRQKQGVLVMEEDLPVNATYVQQVKATGAKTFFTSKWWNGVLVQTDAATLSAINALQFVTKTELVAPGQRLLGGRAAQKDDINESASVNATEAIEFQLAQISLDKMQAQGYRGEAVDIAQFDSGWIGIYTTTPFQQLFNDGRVKATFNFVTNTGNVFTADDHGTEVLSVMAALVPNTFTGGVPKANYFLYLTEDVSSEYRVEEYNWTFAA